MTAICRVNDINVTGQRRCLSAVLFKNLYFAIPLVADDD
ncbi:hypothetical protein DFO53_1118 [Enterobacter sp. AG5470]|nr:hypothetical protein DFO53_1118 [Enterobacter sp. AG5470]